MTLEGVAQHDRAELQRLTERWFVRRGLPHFIDHYSVQIVLVALAIGLFYVLFGLFTMQIPTIEQWTGDPVGDTLATWRWFGADVVLTRQLLRSASFVAAIAGLQFVVTALSDETYRREFVENLQAELHQAFAVRALYLDRVVERDDDIPDATVAGA